MLDQVTSQRPRLLPRSGLGTSPGQSPKALLESNALRVTEEPFLLIRSLRRSRFSANHEAVDAWLRAQQVDRPDEANGLAGSPQRGCCWLEPNAWLVTAQTPLQVIAPTPGLMATAVSDRLTAFRLSGSSARELLSAGFNPAPLRKGRAMRTRLADFATVLVQQWDEADYRLLVDVGLARACAGWLAETGRTIVAD